MKINGDTSSDVGNVALVGKCGLYCAQCRAYKRGRCPGCVDNVKAQWCKVRTCCLESDLDSCADCNEHEDPMACRKYNNFISKVVGFLLRSDRSACIGQIKESGLQAHANKMAAEGKQTIKKSRQAI